MQATIAQAMSAGAEAIEALLKHKEVKPPRPQRAASSVDLPTYLFPGSYYLILSPFQALRSHGL